MALLLLSALGLTIVTVAIHGLGTVEAFTRLARLWQRQKDKPRPVMQLLHVVRTVGVLLALHLLEASVWAGFYVVVEAMPTLEEALYFSLTSYTTIGYGDVLLPARWRLLGPIEGAVGILMFGWSTAIIVAAITRIYGDKIRSLPAPEEPPKG